MGLQRDELIETARSATGLDDFGGDEWVEGLDCLLDSLRDDAALNEMGEVVAASQIDAALTTRLRVIDWHKQHPSVAEIAVAPPIVILGQPRTGTTILFDLLAQDPALRAPLTWEVANPVPPPQTATYRTDPRIAEAEAAASMTEAVIPGFQAIHPSGAERAQECVAITVGDFRSLQWATVFRVPTYARWLLTDADMSSAYRYHRQFLQLLQSEHGGDRWVLKTPGHQWHLRALFATYPEATIIHTHRDPLKVVASVSSLTSVLQKIGTDSTSIPQLAEEWIDHLVVGNDRSVAARLDGTVPPGQAIDVSFTDFMADTFGVLRTIYDQLEREFTAEAEEAMRSFLDANPQDRHGRHTYSFDDTELDLAESRARTASYERHFEVPQEI